MYLKYYIRKEASAIYSIKAFLRPWSHLNKLAIRIESSCWLQDKLKTMDFRLFLTTFLLFEVAWAICPGDFPSGVPLYFGFMTAVDPQSDYVLAGIIPAVDLALELINNNTNMLPGYRLTYNDTIYDAQVKLKFLCRFFCCQVLC